MNKLISCNIN